MVQMPDILFYAELYPFRDSFTQHASIALKYARLARFIRSFGGSAFVLANNETADRIIVEDPSSAFYILRTSKAEDEQIATHYSAWNQDAIRQWVSFATGTSPAVRIFRRILDRIHPTFPFQLVVCWGDNEALNEFAADKGVDVLHLELGPTRDPFPETFYFDPVGTNSRAAFRAQLLNELQDCPDQAFWVARATASHASENRPGPYDLGFMIRSRPSQLGDVGRKICYIPMQLADDLNTQVGSAFSSPLEFLEQVLPRLVESNYLPVIKPHPYAHTRSFNLREEHRALAFAAQDGQALILDSADTDAGTWLIRNADLVLTINSSVGFEASLFGTKVLLAGEAAYDGTRFPRFDDRPVTEQVDTYDTQAQTMAVEQMLGRILYPSHLLASRRFARCLLDCTAGSKVDDVAQRLRKRLGSPVDYALDRDDKSASVGFGVLPGSLAGFLRRDVTRRDDQLLIGDLPVRIDSTAFRTAVEEAIIVEKDGDIETRIRGWAYSPKTKTPPLTVLLIKGGEVVGSAAFTETRNHLIRKQLASCVAGFALSVSGVPLDSDLSLIFISNDLRASIAPVSVGIYEAGDSAYEELLC